MAILVRHKFVSAKEEGPDNSVVRPSNWNDTHTIEMAGSRLMGKSTAGAGDAQEIPLGAGLTFVGGSLSAGTIAGRSLTISNAAPSGGVDGDIWLRY